jgi:hypothetical protein
MISNVKSNFFFFDDHTKKLLSFQTSKGLFTKHFPLMVNYQSIVKVNCLNFQHLVRQDYLLVLLFILIQKQTCDTNAAFGCSILNTTLVIFI